MTFEKTIICFFAGSIATLIGLTVYQSNIPVNLNTSNLYVLEVISPSEDRIIRTKDVGKTKTTVYSGRKIQQFAVNSDKLLITSGEKYKKSYLELINLNNNTSKVIDVGDNYVSKIIPVKNKFVFLYEEVKEGFSAYRAKIGILDLQTEQFTSPKPSYITNEITELYANKEGTLAVFTGFNNYKYIIDLANTENVIKIDTNFNYTANFINENILVAGKYNDENVMFINVSNKSVEKKTLESKYFDSIISNTNNNLFYTVKNGDETSKTYRLTDINKTLNFNSSDSSYTNPILDSTEQFLAFKKSSLEIINIEKEYSKIDSVNSDIVVYDTKTRQAQSSGLKGIKYQFEF
jgi:hypothetical protein